MNDEFTSLEDERQLANLRELDEIGSILGEIEGKYAEITKYLDEVSTRLDGFAGKAHALPSGCHSNSNPVDITISHTPFPFHVCSFL